MYDIDSLFPKQDDSYFSSKLNKLVSLNQKVSKNKKNWQDYFKNLSEAEKWQIDFVQNTDLQKASLSDVKKAYDSARASALAHNEAIKAQTLSAKAGTVALKALSIAGNMIAMWGITKAISLAISAWDYFNVTVKEVQENIDTLTSNINSLNTELNELSSKNNLTDAEQQRLNYLETRIDLEERLLKIEQTRLAQEQLGKSTKITDWFDDDSYVKKATKEFGVYALEDNYLSNPGFNPIPLAIINDYSAYSKGAEAVLREGNEQYKELEYLNNKYERLVEERDAFAFGSHDWQVADERVAKIANKLETYQKQVTSGSYADLLEKYGQYTKEIETLQSILSNSDYLSPNEQKYAQQLLNLYSFNADKIKELINNIAISLGDQSLWIGSDLELLNSKTDRLTADTIQRYFTDEEIKILAHLDFDRNASINTLRALLKEEQEIAGDEPVTLSNILSSESLDKFQSSIKSASDAYTTLLSGNYSSSELLDCMQAITQTASDMGASIDWESISNMEELDKAIQSVSDTYLDSFLSSNNIDPASNFAKMLQNILAETYQVQTAYDAFNSSIDTIQSSYKTLNDAIAEYNQNGYVTLDTLQAVLEIDNQYLSCLMDENGRLSLNEEMYEKLALARLDDAKNTVIQEGILELENIALGNSVISSDKAGEAANNHAQKLKASINTIQKHTRAIMDDSAAVAANNEILDGGAVDDLDAAYQKALAVNEKAANDSMSAIKAKLAFIDSVASNTVSGFDTISNAASSTSSDTSSEFEEQFDFFERRVKVLDNAVTQLKANLENLTGSFAKNQLLDQNSSILEERIRNYSDAAKMYQEKAQESLSRLDAETQKKIVNGSVSLNDYIGEDSKAVTHAMNDYKGWADKVAECTEELANLETQLRQLELDKFNHIVQDFTDQFDLRDSAKGLIDKQISLFEEAGQLVGKAFYEEQIGQTQKQLSLLETEKAQLVNQLNSALSSGRIQRGTEEWLEMVNVLSTVDGNILDCKKSIEEFDNAIQNLHWETFDRVQDTFGNLSDEISNLLDMMKNSEVATPDNQWTAEGLTQLGLYAQQYELATYQVSQYADEIDRLNADYLTGKYSATEYADKLADLNSAQWKAVNAAESAKDSIIDLNESRINAVTDGIQKEIDAYKELINSQIEALDAEKDLHEYQNTIAEKSMSIAKLEKQLAAMRNDNTAATVAKRKQLEEQLTEARADLDETQYEHSVETQKESLNQQYENYENARNQEIESLEETLKDRENIIAISMESVKQNTQIIASQITEIANQHGIKVSSALTNSWASGENAIASYGEVLSQQTSTFIGNIMAVESQIYQLQADADVATISLANMFGTNADNLVNQLNASYFAEVNLLNMTNMLHDSLISTLQSGYDVSSVVNSLKKIKDTIADLNNTPVNIPQLPDTIPDNSSYPSNDAGNDIGKSLNNPGNKHKVPLQNTPKNTIKNASINTAATPKRYAYGTKNVATEQLAITNESGQEFIYRSKDGSILTRLQPGDKVFNNAAVERLYQLGQGLIPADITPHMEIPQLNNIKKAEGTVNMNYDHLIEINGDVNDTDHFIKQISTVAEQAIKGAVKTAEKTRKYGIF